VTLPPEVLTADEFNRPVFQMGPFDAHALARNCDLVQRASAPVEIDWARYYGDGGAFTLTINGREAIALALDDLEPAPHDEILIVTASGGPYISRCVTAAIEERCRWSRDLSSATRAIFLIHEFGFPARLPDALRGADLPIIEDCAYGFGSALQDGPTGRLGDYVIYSLSKSFPIPYGGVLKSRGRPRRSSALSAEAAYQTPILAQYYLERRNASFARRRQVFELFQQRFRAQGFSPLFPLAPQIAPHSFIVALDDQEHAERMKPQMQAAGVISSVYYGGGGYFLPNHQGLSDAAVEYIAAQFMRAYRATA
jgi:hypothetical protein